MANLINRQDLDFILYDVLGVDKLISRNRFQEHSRETFDAAIDTSLKLAERYFEPHNAKADGNEPEFDGQAVSMIPEVKEAIEHYADAGLLAAGYDFDAGGMQLPSAISSACQAIFVAANPSTAAYPFLTTAAANVINAFGSDIQKQQFLGAMLNGRFSGTMALTEPDVGSSLGDLKTSAELQSDGHYLIHGQKMFISGGDHELTENIVHLVLARIKGAPAGVKGISLFIVPKFLVDVSGQCTDRNDVALAGLIHKMGYRGTTSTILNFGEKGDCKGFLIGEPNKGLQYMFNMMNEARIGVGLGATMIGYRGYLSSLQYAKERPQGRHPSNRNPDSKPVMLMEHADIRRMLLAQKSYVEGALLLCLYAATLVDDSETASDDAEKLKAKGLLDLLTPVVKSWPSYYGPKANDLAIQVLGGAGYTREYPVEQCYRDNRLNPIHEGTNGIQALDLLGRKLWQNKRAALSDLLQMMHSTLADVTRCEVIGELSVPFKKALATTSEVTAFLGRMLGEKGPDTTLANASLYLDLFGKVVMSWLWLKQATVAVDKLGGATDDMRPFYNGKIQAARYYLRWELPEIEHQASLLMNMDDTCLNMHSQWF